jgi:3',5'-cyclic AMP phosphodiesterase CpdA
VCCIKEANLQLYKKFTFYEKKMVSVNFDPVDMAGNSAGGGFSLAHISDPHISSMDDIQSRDLKGKRFFGYLKWRLQRSAEHRGIVLSALQDDLARTKPDHIAVTGDLTHLSLPAEYRQTRLWLESLGSPDKVTVIPGNHDTYVKTVWQQTLAHWTDFMLSDDADTGDNPGSGFEGIFPSLRIRGRIALIGVCTALPTAPHLAVGTIGAWQLQKLKTLLTITADQEFFRVVMIHHPPVPGTVSWRKRLTDAPAFKSLIARYGAELILHGHAHTSEFGKLESPNGHVAVIGVPSASALGRKPRRRARYFTYHITPRTSGWHLRLTGRVYSPAKNQFITEHESPFSRLP